MYQVPLDELVATPLMKLTCVQKPNGIPHVLPCKVWNLYNYHDFLYHCVEYEYQTKIFWDYNLHSYIDPEHQGGQNELLVFKFAAQNPLAVPIMTAWKSSESWMNCDKALKRQFPSPIIFFSFRSWLDSILGTGS